MAGIIFDESLPPQQLALYFNGTVFLLFMNRRKKSPEDAIIRSKKARIFNGPDKNLKRTEAKIWEDYKIS